MDMRVLRNFQTEWQSLERPATCAHCGAFTAPVFTAQSVQTAEFSTRHHCALSLTSAAPICKLASNSKDISSKMNTGHIPGAFVITHRIRYSYARLCLSGAQATAGGSPLKENGCQGICITESSIPGSTVILSISTKAVDSWWGAWRLICQTALDTIKMNRETQRCENKDCGILRAPLSLKDAHGPCQPILSYSTESSSRT